MRWHSSRGDQGPRGARQLGRPRHRNGDYGGQTFVFATRPPRTCCQNSQIFDSLPLAHPPAMFYGVSVTFQFSVVSKPLFHITVM